MKPLTKPTRVNDIFFASSGTRKPRQPISSPSVVDRFSITPPVVITAIQTANESDLGSPVKPSSCTAAPTNCEFQPARPTAQTKPYEAEVYASGMKYAAIRYFGFGHCHPIVRMSRPNRRQLTSAAKAGHHMSAGITSPKAMFKCPDQITRVHKTALKVKVSAKKI